MLKPKETEKMIKKIEFKKFKGGKFLLPSPFFLQKKSSKFCQIFTKISSNFRQTFVKLATKNGHKRGKGASKDALEPLDVLRSL